MGCFLYVLMGTITSISAPAPSSVQQSFEDVTAESGITFRHNTGAFVLPNSSHSRLMPETMGAGVVIFDADGDADQDLLFVDGINLNTDARGNTPFGRLYENLGGWKFVDRTSKSGLSANMYGMSAAAADFDGDGDKDVFFAGLGGIRLFANDGRGHFSDVSTALGFGETYWEDSKGRRGKDWVSAIAVFDADGDLDLDVLATQYVKWSPETDIFTTYDGENKGYTSPKAYEGSPPRLWIQHQGRFFDRTSDSGLELSGKSLGIALWDFDVDGLLDVVVANDTMENFLFHNLGSGRFKEIALASGVALDSNGQARAGMGIDIADYCNDGSAGIAIGNFTGEPTSLFHQHGTWQFSELSRKNGIYEASVPMLSFGVAFVDLDLDGWQDLLIANGHVEPGINEVFPNVSYKQPLQLLKNNSCGQFSDIGMLHPALAIPSVGRGLALADLDGDGDLDIVLSNNGSGARVMRNDLQIRRYIRVELIGRSPNVDAIGATITLEGTSLTQKRMIRTGGSYLSQSELIQTFGLPHNESIVRVTVRWPDGEISVVDSPAAEALLRITQPD